MRKKQAFFLSSRRQAAIIAANLDVRKRHSCRFSGIRAQQSLQFRRHRKFAGAVSVPALF
ncbi:MAG: hypothetical protein BHW56_07230 [Acetobacter sp. 46_36]|jgi:hypothetical protein|nr:MAG: hypothetical protein BHW56_07230 [Acetobacter sp. 46_36]